MPAVETPRDHRTAAAPLPNLASIDLNLLVALEALLQHRNVTHAANTVGLSQPAMSRALSRLRGTFNDELLVRTSTGYVRTIRGEMLHERLPAIMDSVRRLVSTRSVRSDDWLSTIRLAMPDHQALVLAKQVLDRLDADGRDREIAIEPLVANALKRMENGELEMVVGQVRSPATTGFFQRLLYVDDHACLVRRGHPALDADWSVDGFYEMRHAVIAGGQGGEPDHVGDALTPVAPRHRCAVAPNAMGAAMTVAESDMVLTVPRRVALRLAAILPLEVKAPPIDIAPYEVMLLWHERSHKNADHEWARAQIAAVAAASDAARDPTCH